MEFIGRNGTLERPAALATGATLSGRTGAGLDPCGALQTSVVLAANASIELVWLLGEAPSTQAAQAMIARWRSAGRGRRAAVRARGLERRARHRHGAHAGPRVRPHAERLAAVPDARVPPLGPQRVLPGERRLRLPRSVAGHDGADRWRSPPWRASTCCAPPGGSSSKATCSTGGCRKRDAACAPASPTIVSGSAIASRTTSRRRRTRRVLDEMRPVPGRAGPAARRGRQLLPADRQPTQSATLFEHCARGLDGSLAVGSHGLPLIGTGDWNDGMNDVGAAGRGESVWLGWFLHFVLSAFVAAGGGARRA